MDKLREINNLPLVTDIKRHSLEDGPGIRSVVFFKGCPLRCIFCHNPETQDPRMEIAFSARECIGCENCEQACPKGAIDLDFPDRIDRIKCTRCGKCAEVCPGKGLRSIGKYYSVETLTEILLRDLSYYRHSGGGVTLSGGECTLYPDYLCSLLNYLKEKQIHVVLETSGYFDYHTFQKYILRYLDLIYYDIKFADSETHKKYTGKSNHIIIGNLKRLLKEPGIEVQPRVPLVADITATRNNLRAIVDILSQTGAKDVTLLPYNPMWIDMAVSLGRPKPALPERFMKPDEEKKIYAMFKRIIEERRQTEVESYG